MEPGRSPPDHGGLCPPHHGGRGGSSRRYLWTDAFASAATLSSSARRMKEPSGSGPILVNRCITLGRHRDDDQRRGWISGLGEEGRPSRRWAAHRKEQTRAEALRERLEWDRDGQYYIISQSGCACDASFG